jgi:hypothetical protein
MSENRARIYRTSFGLVFAKIGTINPGTGVLGSQSFKGTVSRNGFGF